MALTDDLPTDSVLHRHALTERNRRLGLPPSDAVLRRHYDQLQAALRQGSRAAGTVGTVARTGTAPALARVAAAAPAAVVASPPKAAAPRPAAASVAPPAVTPAGPAAPAASGGLFGWLRRLLGA